MFRRRDAQCTVVHLPTCRQRPVLELAPLPPPPEHEGRHLEDPLESRAQRRPHGASLPFARHAVLTFDCLLQLGKQLRARAYRGQRREARRRTERPLAAREVKEVAERREQRAQLGGRDRRVAPQADQVEGAQARPVAMGEAVWDDMGEDGPPPRKAPRPMRTR